MKKSFFILLTAILFIGINGVCNLYAGAIQEGAGLIDEKAGRDGELVLLHTNDLHGNLLPSNGRGGFAEISAFVKSVRAINPNVLLLDAGDFNTGSALSNMYNAEPDIHGFNIMGYDAVTFGNHEFDGTQEKLDTQIALANFPFVSSNIKKMDGSFLGGNQYIVKRYGNISVGIFGLTTLRTRLIASPDSSLIFINELEAARNAVDILRNTEKVDIVIALVHMGDIQETEQHITSIELGKRIEGIDIIVDGHSHSFFESARRAGDAWVVSANEWGKFVGCGKLVVRNGRLVEFTWAPVAITPDAEITAMLRPYTEKANAALKEVIGTASETFIFGNRLTRYHETAIGNMICDANVWYLKNVSKQQVDFAFHNGGNIRAELPAGQITREQLLTVLPFDNYLNIVSMTGAKIIELFNFIATIPQGNGGFPQFSSDVRFTIDKTTSGGVIRNLTIGGAAVDPNKIYRFCTNDYILKGGDGYEVMLSATDPFNTSLLLSYVVIEYIRAQGGTISPATDGRLIIIGGVTP
ncbi:MAG: 5'-nucleotidase C-terminal domain-containing protein [Treponema sp.]|nr:5'-nucleotidase C-terminal domain-containing protein [Treponema sp.]MCL2251902.1 5'-nucleotidase C-terminal domain-containing protein [Treponema sp.]